MKMKKNQLWSIILLGFLLLNFSFTSGAAYTKYEARKAIGNGEHPFGNDIDNEEKLNELYNLKPIDRINDLKDKFLMVNDLKTKDQPLRGTGVDNYGKTCAPSLGPSCDVVLLEENLVTIAALSNDYEANRNDESLDWVKNDIYVYISKMKNISYPVYGYKHSDKIHETLQKRVFAIDQFQFMEYIAESYELTKVSNFPHNLEQAFNFSINFRADVNISLQNDAPYGTYWVALDDGIKVTNTNQNPGIIENPIYNPFPNSYGRPLVNLSLWAAIGFAHFASFIGDYYSGDDSFDKKNELESDFDELQERILFETTKNMMYLQEQYDNAINAGDNNLAAEILEELTPIQNQYEKLQYPEYSMINAYYNISEKNIEPYEMQMIAAKLAKNAFSAAELYGWDNELKLYRNQHYITPDYYTADDQILAILACARLFELTGEESYILKANVILDSLLNKYWDVGQGGLYHTYKEGASQEERAARLKWGEDNALLAYTLAQMGEIDGVYDVQFIDFWEFEKPESAYMEMAEDIINFMNEMMWSYSDDTSIAGYIEWINSTGDPVALGDYDKSTRMATTNMLAFYVLNSMIRNSYSFTEFYMNYIIYLVASIIALIFLIRAYRKEKYGDTSMPSVVRSMLGKSDKK